jgi:hypothetical protein
VNDLFATTTDPLAWEFRHNLFRRGEPHLLASIKRKSARPTQSDLPPSGSPPDDDEYLIRGSAGWMRDPGSQASRSSVRAVSPYRDSSGRPLVYGHNALTGDTVVARTREDDRQGGRGYWDRHPQPTGGISASPRSSHVEPHQTRYHPDPGRASSSTARYVRDYPPENVYQSPSTSSSAVAALSNQLVFLEDRVIRLTEVLNTERLEGTRNTLEMVSYLLQLLGWIGSAQGMRTCAILL